LSVIRQSKFLYMSTDKFLPSSAPIAVAERHALDSAHTVQFYSEDAFLLDDLSRFVGSALAEGDAAIVIATEVHRRGVAQRLKERGLDVSVPLKQGRYVELDAAETLSKFMVDGWPDAARLAQVIGGVIEAARTAAGGKDRHVAAFGEMVALLCEQGKAQAAIRLEQLWNELAQSQRFSLRCAYSMKTFGRPDDGEALFKICLEHTHVLPSEDYAALTDEEERSRHVALLQQKALALESEIKHRKEAEKASRFLAAIVESCDDGIASKDLNGIVTSWNPSAERIFGYKAEEMIGQPITRIIPPELHPDEQQILEKIRRGERIDHFETVRVTKSGERIHVSLSISPLRDSSGHVTGAAKVVRDISERKRAEEALRHMEKLAATGQFAAVIAHEINNPMQALTNVLALISYKSSLDETTRELVSVAERELTRMSHITRQMLSFYRSSSTPVPTKVTDLLEDALELFVMQARSNKIKVERAYESTEEIQGFPGELRQLFANLLSNAIEAVGEHGHIYIRVSNSREWHNGGRRGLRVLIADDGPGIRSEIRKRLFEPFFTTKTEKGNGLGLWVARGIVAKHQGSIRLRSRTGPERSGTVFSVFLPAESARQIVPASAAANAESAA
jgi:PAS domain S-box-containing protein